MLKAAVLVIAAAIPPPAPTEIVPALVAVAAKWIA